MLIHPRHYVAAMLVAATPLAAQQPAAHPTTVPIAHAVRASARPSIDGKLDEAAWGAATPITQFTQSRPDEGKPSSVPTEVRFLFDDEALYVAAKLGEPQGRGAIRAPLARRDQLLASNGDNGSFNSLTTDKVVIALDPYHNHLDEILFEINPAGVRGDQLNGDPSWDPVWEGAAVVNDDGWTAEMRIPYSQLRFSRDSIQSWGLQVRRVSDRLNEQSMWSFRRRDESGGPAYYGHLEGLTITERPRQIELLPYVVSGAQYKYTSPANPYRGTRDMRFNAGADVKYNLTSNLTLDADQSRLRPGRSRSGITQPLGLRDVLRREAAILRGQPRRVRLLGDELLLLQQFFLAEPVLYTACRTSAAAQWVRFLHLHFRRYPRRRHYPWRGQDHRTHRQRIHHRADGSAGESGGSALPSRRGRG